MVALRPSLPCDRAFSISAMIGRGSCKRWTKEALGSQKRDAAIGSLYADSMIVLRNLRQSSAKIRRVGSCRLFVGAIIAISRCSYWLLTFDRGGSMGVSSLDPMGRSRRCHGGSLTAALAESGHLLLALCPAYPPSGVRNPSGSTPLRSLRPGVLPRSPLSGRDFRSSRLVRSADRHWRRDLLATNLSTHWAGLAD